MLQALGLRYIHAAAGLPVAQRRLRGAVLAHQVGGSGTRLTLPQNRDDLFS